MTPDEFIDWLAPAAQRICRSYHLYASVCIAQAAIESGWGRYTIGDYNIFGRKAVAGDLFTEVRTREYYNGELVSIVDKFKLYSSLEDAIEDWCLLLTQEPVYVKHIDNTSLETFVQTLAPIYATNPKYARDILLTIAANQLTQYDD
ncbi:glycoside hydrolase family 73 protein [Sporomusa sphaeroides]|uniref:glycoside hydrolase family 73 protein n=1 Tax=Sporomusa sphaeroides TaxID=47679 RepID=UPI002C2FFC52|nr:glucosaminidase domain-containing protein [Sporomusa sphaeroides]HML32900.1 glucosaminidase domain-containing protein [Sporomusa sphaeroides]